MFVCRCPLPVFFFWLALYYMYMLFPIFSYFFRTFSYFPLVFNGISSLVYFVGMRARPDAKR